MFKANLPVLTPKLKFLVKSTSSTKEASKTLKVIFGVVLAIFSLNFGFIKLKSPNTSFLIKTLCAVQTLTVSFIFWYFYIFDIEDDVFKIWYSMYIIEYCLLVFVLLFTHKYTFFDFCNDLLSIDDELGIVSPNLECIVTTWTVCCLVYRCLLSLIYCTILKEYCISTSYLVVLFFIPTLCADVFLIVCFIIYYVLYYRIKVFTSFISSSKFDIVESQYLYKSIVDIADSVKPVHNGLYVVILIFHTVDMMITVFYPLLKLDIENNRPVNVSTITSVLQVSFMLFSPAFAAGLLSSQVEQLRIVLHERLFQERDQKKASDIERFSSYIKVRPLKTVIWKVIPLDWQLPVIVINLSVTYLIVMFQFSNKF